MRLEQLIYVIEVADNKQINVVSNKLFVTPQNISKSIKQLEEELDVKIFDRTKYGMFLTPDGQLIYNVAVTIQKQLEFLETTFKHKEIFPVIDIRGSLNIIAPAALNLVSNNLLRKLLVKYPNISITYRELETTAIYDRLFESEYAKQHDIIFTSWGKDKHPIVDDLKEKFDVYYLKEETMCVLMSTKSAYAKQQTISLKTLATLPLAGFISVDSQGKEVRPFVEKLLNEYGIQLNFVFLSDSYYNWDKCIDDGIAYGLVGNDYMRNSMKEKNCSAANMIMIPLKEKISTTHMMFIPKEKQNIPQVKVFKDMILEYFHKTSRQLS